MTTPQQQQPLVRVRRDPLAVIAYLVVICAGAGAALAALRESVAAARSIAVPFYMEHSAYTNVQAAHITFTNRTERAAYACVRAHVMHLASKKQVEAVVVCTGEMKPHTTVALEAPYPVGAVEKLCAGEPDRFGFARVDWDRCGFDLEDLSGK
jgi:hypothetical protein